MIQRNPESPATGHDNEPKIEQPSGDPSGRPIFFLWKSGNQEQVFNPNPQSAISTTNHTNHTKGLSIRNPQSAIRNLSPFL
jgi:hypothetical protein